MRKFAVNATNTHLHYSFFMPIVNILWSDHVKMQPISLLLGTKDEWQTTSVLSFLYEEIQKTGHIEFVAPVSGYNLSTSIQTSRLFGFLSSIIEPDDYVLTSDVDMFPIDANYFHTYDESKDVQLYSSNAYNENPLIAPKYPMCYIGAKPPIWQEILSTTTKDISFELQKSFEGRRDEWDNDEMYFDGRFKRSRFYPDRCYFGKREWGHGVANHRLDREHWYYVETRYIDAHSARPGFKYLDLLYKLFSCRCEPQVYNKIKDYINRFLEIHNAV